MISKQEIKVHVGIDDRGEGVCRIGLRRGGIHRIDRLRQWGPVRCEIPHVGWASGTPGGAKELANGLGSEAYLGDLWHGRDGGSCRVVWLPHNQIWPAFRR